MSTILAPSSATALPLRRLYLTRFGFAVVWAVLFATTGSSLGVVAAVLLVLYPAFDVLAAVSDARATASVSTGLRLNAAISTIAAVGLAIAASADIAAVLRVWGTWAVVAGLVQLAVAIARRRLGGQWAMIVSGGLSVVAGSSFVLSSGTATTMTSLAGYAALGGVFFLVSALRLGSAARAERAEPAERAAKPA